MPPARRWLAHWLASNVALRIAGEDVVLSQRIKEKLAAGAPVFLVNPNHLVQSLVGTFGRLGFDGIFIDCERGAASFETVEGLALAARAAGIASFVRPETNLPWLLTRYLDRRVDGLVVPFVQTADEAAAVVKTTGYARPQDHAGKAIVVIVETVKGLANLQAILAVEGIDVFFIGAGDLAQDMGYAQHLVAAGEERPAEVQRAVDSAISQIVAAGKVPGMLVNRANIQRFLRQGVRFFYEMGDNLLALGARDFLTQARGG